MADTNKAKRLGRGLSGLIGTPVAVNIPKAVIARPITTEEPRRTVDEVVGVEAKPVQVPESRFAGVEAWPAKEAKDAAPVVRPSVPAAAAGAPPDARPTQEEKKEEGNGRFVMVGVGDVVRNRFQPREEFDEKGLMGLAESIRSQGVMQPLVVRKVNRRGGVEAKSGGEGVPTWELIAGERRLRAARLVGLAEVPAVVVDVPDEQAAMWAVVENVQRTDLGVIEKARAYRSLSDRFGMTHAEIARQVGEDRSVVSNYIRILDLEDEIVDYLKHKQLTFGHARVLLTAEGMKRVQLAREAAENACSVRWLEEQINESAAGERVSGGGNPLGFGSKTRPGAGRGTGSDLSARADLEALEREIGAALGTKVRLRTKKGGKAGEVVLKFYSLEHFDGLLEKLGVRSGERGTEDSLQRHRGAEGSGGDAAAAGAPPDAHPTQSNQGQGGGGAAGYSKWMNEWMAKRGGGSGGADAGKAEGGAGNVGCKGGGNGRGGRPPRWPPPSG